MRYANLTTSTKQLRSKRLSVVALAATLLLSACGGQSDKGSSPTVPSLGSGTEQLGSNGSTVDAPTDYNEATALYMECMQDNGISMAVDDASNVDVEAYVAADAKCQKHMVNAVSDLEISPEDQARLKDLAIAYAKCMSAAGFDVQATPEGGITAPIDISSQDGYSDADTRCGADLRDATEAANDSSVQP